MAGKCTMMEKLKEKLSKWQIAGIARELHHDEVGIHKVCNQMLCSENVRLSCNAAWVLYHLPAEDKRIYLSPVYDKIADLAVTPCLHIRRGLILSLLIDLTTDKNFRTDLFDFCLAHIADKDEANSSRSMMIKLAAKMCRLVPELANELAVCLDMLEYEMTPSVSAARRNAMKVIVPFNQDRQ